MANAMVITMKKVSYQKALNAAWNEFSKKKTIPGDKFAKLTRAELEERWLDFSTAFVMGYKCAQNEKQKV